MSYKPTPKTSYGDTDFSDDTWSPQGSSSINPPPPPNYAAPPPPPQYPGMGARGLNTVTQPPYGQGQPMNPTQYAGMDPMQRGQTNPLAALASSITQEDILFMRSWQRDSFYYRVIPAEVIGLGSMYMYNKTKSLPHSIPKYLAMATVAFIFGKWTYRDEFKRRLAESPLNTPYMQTMRKSLGIAQSVKSEFSDSGLAYSGGKDEFSDTWSSDAGSSAFQPAPAYTDDRQFGSSGLAPTSYDSPLGSDRLDNQANVDAAKPQVTYEELRARNRGFMK